MITPAAPVAQPTITTYDIKIVSIDFQHAPVLVNIVYSAQNAGAQVAPDQVLTITWAQLLATPGADPRLKMLNAVANAVGLVSPTIT